MVIVLAAMSCSRGTGEGGTWQEAERWLDKSGQLTASCRYDSALSCLDSAWLHAAGNDTARGYVMAERANCLLMAGRMRAALPCALQAIAIGEGINNAEILVNQYSSVGVIYRRLGLADSAVYYYKKGVDIAKSVEANDYVANLFNNIAVVYTEADRLAEGLAYARQAERLSVEAGDTVEMFSARATQASVYLRRRQYEKVVSTLTPHAPAILSTGHAPLALKTMSPVLKAYVQMGQLDNAEHLVRRLSSAIQQVAPASNGALGIRQIEADIAHGRKQYARELLIWQEIAGAACDNGSVPRSTLLQRMAQCYAALGYNDKAYKLSREAFALLDSVKNSEAGRQMSELSVRYKSQQKDLAIATLSREKAQQRAQMMLVTAVGTLVVAALVVALVVMSYRRRAARHRHQMEARQQYIEGLESERARLAKELHDGVCNDLLGLRMMAGTAGSGTCAAIDRIRRDVRHISHELMPPRFNTVSIVDVLADYLGHYPLNGATVSFHAGDSCQWGAMPPVLAQNIYRIVQEAMGNIAMHSHATYVEVDIDVAVAALSQAKGRIVALRIVNDGSSPDSEAGAGIGRNTISERIASVGGAMRASVSDSVYTLLIELPILQ